MHKGGRGMGSTFRDLRYGLRMLLQNRVFTAVALVSLALGIGANTTIFSVLNAVLFRSFPVKEPERLVVLLERKREERRVPTFAAFQEWKRQNHVFEDIALTGMGGDAATLTSKKEAAWITFDEASVNFFSVAGVAPALGRTFLPEDSKPGDGMAIILSHDFWQRHFDGDKNIIGQTVAVEGMKMTVIGVMPPGFWLVPWAAEVDAWSTFDASKNPKIRFMIPIARLRPGVTLEQARAEMGTLFGASRNKIRRFTVAGTFKSIRCKSGP